jgi:arylsulfatase A-like enzyme
MEMGTYGYPLATTPSIDRWASRGIVFDNAFAPAPWTLPSHASLFTGKWPHETGTGWSIPMPEGHLTLARRLGSLGYATGGFAANTVYASWLFGLQDGFSRYRDYHRSPSEIIGASSLGRWVIVRWNRWRGDYVMVGRVSAREVNGSFDRWQRGVEAGRPWFAFINYFDAHDPYDPEEPYRTMFPGTEEKWRSLAALRQRPPEELRALQAAYDGAIAALDEEVGRLLDDLERRGILQNTLVVITSDHGEEFGEHGITGHGASQYIPVLHVPLIVIAPDSTRAGARIHRFVSLRDVPATIEDLVTATARQLPGSSLRPLWSGDTLAPVSPVFSDVQRLGTLPGRYPTSHHDIQSLIVEDRWHLIRPEGGAPELYDLSTDSLEKHNLAGSATHADRLRTMIDSVTRLRGR